MPGKPARARPALFLTLSLLYVYISCKFDVCYFLFDEPAAQPVRVQAAPRRVCSRGGIPAALQREAGSAETRAEGRNAAAPGFDSPGPHESKTKKR